MTNWSRLTDRHLLTDNDRHWPTDTDQPRLTDWDWLTDTDRPTLTDRHWPTETGWLLTDQSTLTDWQTNINRLTDTDWPIKIFCMVLFNRAEQYCIRLMQSHHADETTTEHITHTQDSPSFHVPWSRSAAVQTWCQQRWLWHCTEI